MVFSVAVWVASSSSSADDDASSSSETAIIESSSSSSSSSSQWWLDDDDALLKSRVAKNTTSRFLLVSEHQHKGLSLFLDGTNALRETTTTHSLQLPNAKKSDKEERGRERERETFLGEDFLLSRCFSLDKGRGDNKELVFFKRGGVFCSRIFNTPTRDILSLSLWKHREREKTKRTPVSRSTYSM